VLAATPTPGAGRDPRVPPEFRVRTLAAGDGIKAITAAHGASDGFGDSHY
jgi:hypothetical protein